MRGNHPLYLTRVSDSSFVQARGTYFKDEKKSLKPIETEWEHSKDLEIAGRMFDNELKLAYAVMQAIESRSQQ